MSLVFFSMFFAVKTGFGSLFLRPIGINRVGILCFSCSDSEAGCFRFFPILSPIAKWQAGSKDVKRYAADFA